MYVLLSAPPPSPTPPDRPPARPPGGRPLREAAWLEGPANYDRVFQVVRAAVHRVLGIGRPGLGLGLSDLPPGLGAYWQVSGNVIVLNEGLVAAMRSHARTPLELNSFVYVLLAHEYLHALGYLDEGEVRRVTAYVTQRAFGPDHPASRMASGDLWRMFPFLSYTRGGNGQSIRIVRQFDTSSTDTYIR
ncbi:MAG: hypothetical protein LVQ64_00415 [Thermoplasmatales archaeon]|nr:hypothetical protein [Thermoplasmatales archaeon]